ncbi:MAG: acetyl-coenzyme A synthetase N-terminal domain-containing protein, partial [Pseudohongiellaceae bacterium]
MSSDKVYPVNKEIASRAFANAHQYEAMYEASIERPEEFWNQKANELLTWFKPWEKLSESDMTRGEAKWFIGGQLNACYNCVDRHLEYRGDQTAIIWEGDDPSVDTRVTYRELYDKVCRLANVLKDRGVKKGDRVCIYMP